MMPQVPNAFSPATSQNLVTGAASASVALAANGPVVRVFNAGSTVCYIAFGDSTVVAADLTSIGIPPNGVETFQLPPANLRQGSASPWYIAAISPGGAGNLNFQTGEGL